MQSSKKRKPALKYIYLNSSVKKRILDKYDFQQHNSPYIKEASTSDMSSLYCMYIMYK